MKRPVMLVAASWAALSLGACKGQVDVVAQLVNQNPSGAADTTALKDLPVHLVPFDRDLVFDSLQKAYSQPEPAIPDSITQLQQQIMQAQDAYQQSENEWATVRDSLQNLSNTMKHMNKATAQYVVMFRTFNDLDAREKALNTKMGAAFKVFTGMQAQFSRDAQQIRAERAAWSNAAFAAVDSVFSAKEDKLGRKEMADTTTATGLATFNAKTGKWWIYARYELPYTELYWNVPIEVKRGKPLEIILNRANAKKRPRL